MCQAVVNAEHCVSTFGEIWSHISVDVTAASLPTPTVNRDDCRMIASPLGHIQIAHKGRSIMEAVLYAPGGFHVELPCWLSMIERSLLRRNT
jgi:hypothetical protein